jgi:hypothetical protein
LTVTHPIQAITKAKPAFFPKTLYKDRIYTEQAVGNLNRLKRIVLRCEKPQEISCPSSICRQESS